MVNQEDDGNPDLGGSSGQGWERVPELEISPERPPVSVRQPPSGVKDSSQAPEAVQGQVRQGL